MTKMEPGPVHLMVYPHEIRRINSLRGYHLLDRMQIRDLTQLVTPDSGTYDGSLRAHSVHMLDMRHAIPSNVVAVAGDFLRRAVVFDFTTDTLDPAQMRFFRQDGTLSEPGQTWEPLPEGWEESMISLIKTADVVTCSYKHMVKPLKKIGKRVVYVPDMTYGDPASEAAYVIRMSGVIWYAQRAALRRLGKAYKLTDQPLRFWQRVKMGLWYAKRLEAWRAYARELESGA